MVRIQTTKQTRKTSNVTWARNVSLFSILPENHRPPLWPTENIHLPGSFSFQSRMLVSWRLDSPCVAVVADISDQFVGHTAAQRLGGVHQLSPSDAGCRPQTVTLSRADKTLQFRCHSRFSLHVNWAVFTSVNRRTRCVMASHTRTDPSYPSRTSPAISFLSSPSSFCLW